MSYNQKFFTFNSYYHPRLFRCWWSNFFFPIYFFTFIFLFIFHLPFQKITLVKYLPKQICLSSYAMFPEFLCRVCFLHFLLFLPNFRLGVGHLITTTCKDVCGKYSNDAGGFSGVADQVADAGKFT